MSTDGNRIRKLTAGRQVARNVLVIRSDSLKMLSAAFVRIEHGNSLAILTANHLNGSDLIRIPRNEYETIGPVVRRINNSRHHEIYIRPFLFHLVDLN